MSESDVNTGNHIERLKEIVTCYESRLENDEAFLHEVNAYLVNLMEQQARLRDLDDKFFEFLKETVIDREQNKSYSVKRNILCTSLKAHVVHLFELGNARDVMVEKLQKKHEELTALLNAFDKTKDCQKKSGRPIGCNDIESYEHLVVNFVMGLLEELLDMQLIFNCESLEILTNAFRKLIDCKKKFNNSLNEIALPYHAKATTSNTIYSSHRIRYEYEATDSKLTLHRDSSTSIHTDSNFLNSQNDEEIEKLKDNL